MAGNWRLVYITCLCHCDFLNNTNSLLIELFSQFIRPNDHFIHFFVPLVTITTFVLINIYNDFCNCGWFYSYSMPFSVSLFRWIKLLMYFLFVLLFLLWKRFQFLVSIIFKTIMKWLAASKSGMFQFQYCFY